MGGNRRPPMSGEREDILDALGFYDIEPLAPAPDPELVKPYKGRRWPVDELLPQFFRDNLAFNYPFPAIGPAALARAIGRPAPSMRRALRTLELEGFLTNHGGLYSLRRPGWDDLTDEQREEWRQVLIDCADGRAVKAFVDDTGRRADVAPGTLCIVVHSKGLPPSTYSPPAYGSGEDPADARRAAPSGNRWNGRQLRMSPAAPPNEWGVTWCIPVLFSPLPSLEIIDDDTADTTPVEGAIGVQPTPHGRHWYRRRSFLPCDRQDPVFAECSAERGGYHQRLFNDDGTPRPAPSALPTAATKDAGLIAYIARAWEAAQSTCIARGIERGAWRNRAGRYQDGPGGAP